MTADPDQTPKTMFANSFDINASICDFQITFRQQIVREGRSIDSITMLMSPQTAKELMQCLGRAITNVEREAGNIPEPPAEVSRTLS